MSIRNLEFLFRPKSVAVIGASDRPGSLGGVVVGNILAGGFAGPVFAVNPGHASVAGLRCYRRIARLPATPELALVCTPPAAIPGVVAELGARGTRAVIVLPGGLDVAAGRHRRTLRTQLLAAARPHLLRVLGPASGGLIVPGLKLVAGTAHARAMPGRIAFVSQSDAIAATVLDWANSRGIGFSCFVHLGESADVDAGDVLDYLASDPDTASILLYIESVTAARKFMSAARAAARNKPVVVLKAGRGDEGARLAVTGATALVTTDRIYDAAIRRAGMLRVFSTADLLDAAETLARARPLRGDRLGVLTNGHGPGVMAADALVLGGGRLAPLAEETLTRLAPLLPPGNDAGNPLDIGNAASPERYAAALRTLLAEPQCDALLLIHAPTSCVTGESVARAVADAVQGVAASSHTPPCSLFACWLGGDEQAEARRHLNSSGIPTYDTPEKAVQVFLQINEYRRNQALLMQLPPSVPMEFQPDARRAKSIVRRALAAGRSRLTEQESKGVLVAYGMPVVEARLARSGGQAARLAETLGFPVALKLLTVTPHGPGVGGIATDLESAADVRAAAASLRRRLRQRLPQAPLTGYSVQPLGLKPAAHELLIGVVTDPVFGPVVLFGKGGAEPAVVADRAIALPPLNMALARDLVSRTRVSRLLAGGPERPAADPGAIHLALVQISQLIADVDEIAELEINPLLADAEGVMAQEVRVRLRADGMRGLQRLAIRPYPRELEEDLVWRGRKVLLRPIRPEDEPALREFLASLATEDLRLRFFSVMREVPRSQLARFTQIDYDREMAFVAVARDDNSSRMLGEVRAVADPDNAVAEFAIVVRSELKGQGLGTLLLMKMIGYCYRRGTGALHGETLVGNERMLTLARECGFALSAMPEEGAIELRLALHPRP